MRDIKFRAWNVDDEIMLYSDFNAMGFYSLENAQEIAENTETVFMYHAYTGDKDFVLLQYTGLKDKNGKEIYEGDIVSMFQGTQKSEVLFDSGMFSVKRAYRTSFYHDELELRHEILFNVIDTCEVIGNIYENPELLTQYEETAQ